MKSSSRKSSPKRNWDHSDNGLKSLRFEDTAQAVPPRPSSLAHERQPNGMSPGSVKQAESSADARHSLLRKRVHNAADVKGDAGVSRDTPVAANGFVSKNQEGKTADVPAVVIEDEASSPQHQNNVIHSPTKKKDDEDTAPKEQITSADSPAGFKGIETDIPTGDIDDPFSSDQMHFSNRGSVLLGDERLSSILENSSKPPSRMQSLRERVQRPMSMQEHRLSKRVRSMYECGDEKVWESLNQPSPIEESKTETVETNIVSNLPRFSNAVAPSTDSAPVSRSASSAGNRRTSMIKKEPWEAAGGIEDWQDVEGGDVDRYGFIKPQNLPSRGSSSKVSTPLPGSPDPYRRRRSAEGLATVQESSHANSHQDATNTPPISKNKRFSFVNGKGRTSSSLKPKNSTSASIYSSRSKRSTTSTLRRSSRWMAEATDMIDLSPDFANISNEERPPEKVALERKREEKWAKMAKVLSKPSNPKAPSGATEYAFDVTNSKVVSRTWKGIPDRWRATAWHAFLTASTRKQQGKSAPSEEDLIEDYHVLQALDCPDDVQIDTDVPRTIGGHIMFRRRYRGGQRLMFRVLHALALYFPETGYVQGMAPLAATLLCYYDEERAFVMAVRLWALRGLQVLYKPGFEGLFAALEEFEGGWLRGRELKRRLDALDIAGTSYGTKWYLTLFSYSIPFAAQLRVWDIFMLLGDPPSMSTSKKRQQKTTPALNSQDKNEAALAEANFDVLHAVAAALLDGLQDVLLDAEFENAMKTLTSPIPVTNEDLLMRTARREYRERRKKR